MSKYTAGYHSWKASTVPGMSDAERGEVHALDPETLIALCGFSGAYPVAPMALSCRKCMKALAKAEGGDA